MSLNSHFDFEIEHAGNLSNEMIEHLKALYAIFETGGHSGGSAAFVLGYLKHHKDNLPTTWNADTEISLKGMFEYFAPMERSLVSEILTYFIPLADYKPLGLLTGEDWEWAVGDFDPEQAQNKRCGNIFKILATGQAYNSCGRVFYEPSSSYDSWSGWTGFQSRVDITFPYDPATPAQEVHYVDRRRTCRIPFDVKPIDFLKGLRAIHYSGLNPETMQIYPALLMTTEEEMIAVIDIVISIFGETEVLTAEALDGYIAKHRYDEDNVIFTRVMRVLSQFTIGSKIKSKRGSQLVVSGADWLDYYVGTPIVVIPTRNYQDWKPLCDKEGKTYMVHHVSTYKPRQGDQFEMDNNIPVSGQDHLYSKRRELGLAHPKRKPIADVLEAHPAIDKSDEV